MFSKMTVGILVVLISTSLSWGTVPATTPTHAWKGTDTTRIIFQGRIITAAELSHLMNLREVHCHDAAGAHLVQCFATEQEVAADIHRYSNRSALTEQQGQTSAPVLASCAYVTLYEDTDFGGSSATLCNDRPNLGDLRWDNRAESLKTFSSTFVFPGLNYTGKSLLILDRAPIPDLQPLDGGRLFRTISSVRKE
ncbi:MAG: beta/gamma crystallin family protein [Blastochloris sp.]|nr:beta/gamma crystallin family protein [Blastochloris sp.]